MYSFHAGMIPAIPEHPCNRTPTKRGRKRLGNATLHALRAWGAWTVTWEDAGKRLLLRFARIQPRHAGMQLLAYMLMHLRAFCGTSNLHPVPSQIDRREQPWILRAQV